MPRQRWLLLSVLGGVMALDAPELLAQRPGGGGGYPGGSGGSGFPGGGGGGGRPQMDPEALWQRMSNGADSIDLNKNPQMKMMVQMGGGQVPQDGILTKQMFQTAMAQRAARGPAGSGQPGGFGGPSAMPVPATGGPVVVSVGSGGTSGDKPIVIGAPGSMPAGPGSYPGGGFPGGGPGFPGGMDPDALFKMSDKNGDGKISREEASRRLQPTFDQYDTNRDGFIDSTEFKAYLAVAMSGVGGGGPGGDRGDRGPGGAGLPGGPGGYSGGPGGFPSGADPKIEDAENERPVVYRFGKLPKDFPYSGLDKDEDGQISLYEWRTASKSVDEFLDRDLNGDGFLTAEEWLRGTKSSLGGADAKKENGRGSLPGGSMGGRGPTAGGTSAGVVPGGNRGTGERGNSGEDKKDRKGKN